MHHNNIMHRDIKPENLVFDENGYLYLTDMGIARLYRRNHSIIDSSGTSGYMAPEVINNENHDLTCDYFAIGVLVHELMLFRVILNFILRGLLMVKIARRLGIKCLLNI